MTIATVPTLPNATEAQVRRALEIAAGVYAAAGVPVRLEPVRSRDPEIADSDVIELYAWVLKRTPFEEMRPLIDSVPKALREAGLYEPEVAIASHLVPGW